MEKESIATRALIEHEKWRGKIEVASRVHISSMDDLSMAYTPGVAEPCREIHRDKRKVYQYTRKWNTIAVVTDGTAVLGLGDIGPEAGLPVMEGKALLFKEFAGVDAVPIALATKDPDEIVNTVTAIAPTFGGINLEDISAPRCFDIERRLIEKLDIPVFHDDQHGTAIVVLAGLMNALELTGKDINTCRIVINGAGSAGIACAHLLLSAGTGSIMMCDKFGIISEGMDCLNSAQQDIAKLTNRSRLTGSLADAMQGADVLIGVSAPGAVSSEMVRSMNSGAIVFAMANPIPEIFPEQAIKAGAAIVGTGRSDYPNQVNNVLAFPGIFRGVLDSGARLITNEIKIAAAKAIADTAKKDGLAATRILPNPLDKRVAQNVADAVAAQVR